MHFKLLNPSKYLQATDFEAPDWRFGREPTFTIRQVALEKMEGEKKDETKVKGMILVAEQPKGWVMNVTNAKCMAAMWGDETNAWVGKRITLCSERVYAFGEWVPGIRIKGSPDLTEPRSVTIKLRKKTETVNLVKTSAAAPKANGQGTAKTEWITFGVGSREAKRIVELSVDDLTASIALAEKNIAAVPVGTTPKWLAATQSQLEALRGEAALRAEARAAQGEPAPAASDDKPPF